MKRTVQMATGNAGGYRPRRNIMGCFHYKNGIPRRAMKKRGNWALMNFPLMAAIAGPMRNAFMSLMAFAQQKSEDNVKRQQELSKRGPQ